MTFDRRTEAVLPRSRFVSGIGAGALLIGVMGPAGVARAYPGFIERYPSWTVLAQALPEHPVPDAAQVTPLPLESLLTEAVKSKVCPRSILV